MPPRKYLYLGVHRIRSWKHSESVTGCLAQGDAPYVPASPCSQCHYGCRYCYARVTHTYYDLNVGRDFEEIIFVKENLPQVLQQELRRPGWRYESIAIGTATDPYQPAEGRFHLTRQCLEVLAAAANPCSVTTKGTLVLRDIDLMQQLVAETRFSVHLSLITLERDLWRRLEPGAPPPAARLKALERLRTAGIPVSVFLMPVVPGLTDRPEHLAEVVHAAANCGATGIAVGTLRLAPGLKEWFFRFLGAEYPQFLPDYRRWYGTGTHAPRAYARGIAEAVEVIKEEAAFQPAPERPQPDRVGRQYVFSL